MVDLASSADFAAERPARRNRSRLPLTESFAARVTLISIALVFLALFLILPLVLSPADRLRA